MKIRTKGLKTRLERSLKEIGCWPQGSDYLTISHGSSKGAQKNRKAIDDHVNNDSGIYLYKKAGRVTLYVGKAKLLKSRLKAHYNESYKKAPKKSNAKRWYSFFRKHKGEVKIYCRKLNNERDRRVLEAILSYCLKPEFDKFEKKTLRD